MQSQYPVDQRHPQEQGGTQRMRKKSVTLCLGKSWLTRDCSNIQTATCGVLGISRRYETAHQALGSPCTAHSRRRPGTQPIPHCAQVCHPSQGPHCTLKYCAHCYQAAPSKIEAVFLPYTNHCRHHLIKISASEC